MHLVQLHQGEFSIVARLFQLFFAVLKLFLQAVYFLSQFLPLSLDVLLQAVKFLGAGVQLVLLLLIG